MDYVSMGFQQRLIALNQTVANNFANGDQDMVKCVQARFVGSVYPGETICYKMWKNGN